MLTALNTPARFILFLTLVRILWHLFTPVGMTGDESYYWLWGQHFDLGYYSKPPFIGWFFGLMDFIPLPKNWLFKTCATLFSSGCLYYVYQTILTCCRSRRAAFYGLLALGLSPANLLFASILTIDSPLMFFWAGAMYYASKLCFATQPSPKRDFLGLFIFLAFGHLCKQMMLVQLPIIILCALFIKRSLLRSLLFWITLLGSLVSLVPPLMWNADNQWITLQHTGHHFEASSPSFMKSLGRLGELMGALLGLVSPIIFLQLFPAIRSALGNFIPDIKEHKNRASVFFLTYGGIGLIVMLGMVFRQRVNANWPAVFLIGGLGLTVFWAFQRDVRRKWFRRGLKVSGVLTALLMVFLLCLEPFSESLAKIGLKPQRRGWQGYPTLTTQIDSHIPKDVTQIVFTGHRFSASQFAFHGKQNLKPNQELKSVHLWNGSDHIRNQFDFFPAPVTGKPVAVIVEQKKPTSSDKIPEKLQACLSDTKEVAQYSIHKAREYPRYKVFLAQKLTQWPESPASSTSH